jgi:uncharacterized protein (DUF1501 family)
MSKLTRRAALLGLAGAVSCGGTALAVAAAPTDRRLVVVLLRGALDGLTAVPPYGDANLVTWRAGLVPPQPGRDGGAFDLGGFYGLHPALAGLHDLYAAGDLLVAHAVAGSWRSRSHFDAQDYLEFGVDHRIDSGWLNRVVTALPPRLAAGETGLAVGTVPPLLLRGPAPVGSWLPEIFQPAPPDLYARIAALHANDPVTGPAIAKALRERGFADATLGDERAQPGRFAFPALAGAAGRLLAAADGPRIAALEVGGWDTHSAQAARLVPPLRELDGGIVALRQGLGAAWRQTVVLVMTEFGRTVRINGTNGTDHGTATVAFVVGGAVKGGRVRADWPGLREAALFENRDLAPTADLRGLVKGVLADHFGLDTAALGRVFPESRAASLVGGLIRA